MTHTASIYTHHACSVIPINITHLVCSHCTTLLLLLSRRAVWLGGLVGARVAEHCLLLWSVGDSSSAVTAGEAGCQWAGGVFGCPGCLVVS
jgi:hypothetical protein